MPNTRGFIAAILISLFGLNITICAGEKASVQILKNIEWQNANYPELPFKGQGYYTNNNQWPVLVVLIPFPSSLNYQQAVIAPRALEWQNIEDDYSFLNDTSVKENPHIFNHKIIFIRKVPYIELEIIPFRKSNTEPNLWQRLLKYSVSIQATDSTSAISLKSAEQKYTFISMLSSGNWVKIGTTQRGIHKIPYTTLRNWGFNNPEKIQVYGYGGMMVPMKNSEERPDDLPPVPCWHQNDALFFFSNGPWQWTWNEERNMFEYSQHPYSPSAFYFLSEADNLLSPQIQEPIDSEANYQSTTYDYIVFHENEKENLLNSGSQWLGEKFSPSGTLERTFTFDIPNFVPDSEVILYSRVAGRSNSSHYFNISINDAIVQTLTLSTVSLSDYLGYYARTAEGKVSFSAASSISLSYQYVPSSTSSVGWLDFFILQARNLLTLQNGPLVFRDHNSVASDRITEYRLTDAPSNAVIWDVTNPLLIRQMTTIADDNTNTIIFKDSSNVLKEYVAFSPDMDIPVPEFIEAVTNQNLHASTSADLIIVTPEEFSEQAVRLANLHATYSGLSVLVARRDQIYNEFSWGHPDPGAIRAFLKMLYDRAGDDMDKAPKLLLLFGDGSYDNRHIDNQPAAPLPTYQSESSFYQTASFVTDDFFGFLDNEEGDNLQSDRLDIGIGRFPVNSVDEAKIAVDKTEAYLLNQEMGRWKTRLTFVGDDGDNNIHMQDADKLAQKIAQAHPEFDLNKIYLDNYQAYTSATGREFPNAKIDAQEAITEGTLIWNFSGHGSESALAHEKIITMADIETWTNKNRLPLFVTATCEFSRFDNHEYTSAGEKVFLSPNGGAIALLSTTRIVYASLNYTLNNAFYNHAFEYDETGEPLRLGEMMRRTKLESGSNTNKLNFTLLGDPALQLIFPPYHITTVEINNTPVADETDTIKALSHNTLVAHITDSKGNVITDFNGTAFITVYDKEITRQTLGNDGNTPFEFSEYANILFSGRATVKNGLFQISFVVPQDIRYNFDQGRISYYALADDNREAFGAFSDIVVGGISENIGTDTTGPEIQMYLNHSQFKDGDQTTDRPMLYARLFDESGINTSGIGIGHDITLVIDEDINNPVILNDYFTADIDDYKSGMIEYQVTELDEGVHTLTLKVWDNYNNSSTKTLNFKVSKNHGINGRNIKIYPNPVKPGDDVYITLTTDIPNALLSVTIQFFNAAGQITGTTKDELITDGNTVGPFKLPIEQSGWNYNGVCFVRIILESQTESKEQFTVKLLPYF